MGYSIKCILSISIYFCLITPQLTFSQNTNEAIEPSVKKSDAIDLLKGGTLNAWKVPSAHWHIEEDHIIAYTGDEQLDIPEWLYTKEQFGDFVFTCELKLTGDNRRNTGIYYRVNTFTFENYQGNKSFEAASGYEFDVAHNRRYLGSLGDWYARPSLRILPDTAIVNQVYKTDEWNRFTLRARGNRLEYWINGIKVLDYIDNDPKASRKGFIGFQIHDGSVMKIECRNIRVMPLKP